MSERSNQTAEIAMRYYIATLEDSRLWSRILFKMSAALNNSTNYSFTLKAPNEIMFDFKTREALNLLRLKDPEQAAEDPDSVEQANHAVKNFPVVTRASNRPPAPLTDTARRSIQPVTMKKYRPTHIDVKDAIVFAAMKMKEYYDAHHQFMFFRVNDFVNIRLHRGYSVPAIKSKKIEQQLIDPFKIIKRVGRLAYQLELPVNMKIHKVLFVAHLKPITNPRDDSYQRHRVSAPPLVIDDAEEFEIKQILAKRRIRKKTE